MSDKVLLVFGGDGQPGRALAKADAPTGWAIVTLPRAAADITNADQVARAIGVHEPAVVVNAAAYTAVDKAESDDAAAKPLVTSLFTAELASAPRTSQLATGAGQALEALGYHAQVQPAADAAALFTLGESRTAIKIIGGQCQADLELTLLAMRQIASQAVTARLQADLRQHGSGSLEQRALGLERTPE